MHVETLPPAVHLQKTGHFDPQSMPSFCVSAHGDRKSLYLTYVVFSFSMSKDSLECTLNITRFHYCFS